MNIKIINYKPIMAAEVDPAEVVFVALFKSFAIVTITVVDSFSIVVLINTVDAVLFSI